MEPRGPTEGWGRVFREAMPRAWQHQERYLARRVAPVRRGGQPHLELVVQDALPGLSIRLAAPSIFEEVQQHLRRTK